MRPNVGSLCGSRNRIARVKIWNPKPLDEQAKYLKELKYFGQGRRGTTVPFRSYPGVTFSSKPCGQLFYKLMAHVRDYDTPTSCVTGKRSSSELHVRIYLGGDEEIRTLNRLLAKQMRSPITPHPQKITKWWSVKDLNF